MDTRSFYLNAECMAIIDDDTFAQTICDTIEEDLNDANRVTQDDIEQFSLPQRMLHGIARSLRPIL